MLFILYIICIVHCTVSYRWQSIVALIIRYDKIQCNKLKFQLSSISVIFEIEKCTKYHENYIHIYYIRLASNFKSRLIHTATGTILYQTICFAFLLVF